MRYARDFSQLKRLRDPSLMQFPFSTKAHHVSAGDQVRDTHGLPSSYRRSQRIVYRAVILNGFDSGAASRSEEHTSELQSLMRISYAVFCLKKKKHKKTIN